MPRSHANAAADSADSILPGKFPGRRIMQAGRTITWGDAQMRREKARVTIMFCSIVLAGVAFAANASAACNRETLQKLADTYVKAQTAGKATMLPLAQGRVLRGERQGHGHCQGRAGRTPEGRLHPQLLRHDAMRHLHGAGGGHGPAPVRDPHAHGGDQGREGVEDGVGGDGRGGLGVRRGRAPCLHAGPRSGTRSPRTSATRERPSRRRPTRTWTIGGTRRSRCRMARPAPGSKAACSTAARNPEGHTCTMGAFPQKLKVTNRRYVIDETIGAVDIFHNFPWIDAGLPKRSGDPDQPDVSG